VSSYPFRPASFISDEIEETVSTSVMYWPVLVFIAILLFIYRKIFTRNRKRTLWYG
jgi:hypothetical protein